MMSLLGDRPRRATVRTAQDDVASGATKHDVVAVQAEHHVVGRTASNDVGAVERLVGCRTRLESHIVLAVVVGSDQELRPRRLQRSTTGLRGRKQRARDRDRQDGG
jgi:hypothetical protein